MPRGNPINGPAPIVSVIVPAYNAESTLGDCLTALAETSGPSHEVIVVDDGSTDATAMVAERFDVRLVRLARQSGAAVARNVGAEHARADLLFFTDADVLLRRDALERAVALLERCRQASAVFGSYTAWTVHDDFFSVYKNFVHHLTHQTANPEAATFWSGVGAIRASAFWAVGGFDASDTRSSDVEDIALGYRLTRAGYRVRLDRELQGTHAKRYTLVSLVRSDLFHRAIPWTRLMLREGIARRDLNTSLGGVVSAAVVLLLGPTFIGGLVVPPLSGLAAGLFLLYVLLNRRLFAACARRNPRFLLPAVAMTALYYVYATAGAAIGLVLHLVRPRKPAGPAFRCGSSRTRSQAG